MSKKFKIWINVSLVAAAYVALTFALAPLSYGAIQFRLSEVLMMLVCYNPIYSISMIFGCFIANIMSPMEVYDMIIGTAATVLACGGMILLKRSKIIASLMPAIFNALIIGAELNILMGLPFALSALEVFLGEFVVVSIIGVPAFKALEKQHIAELLEFKNVKENKADKYLNSAMLFMFAAMACGIVLFFKLPLYVLDNGETYSLFAYSIGQYGLGANYWLFIILAISVFVFVNHLFKNKKVSFIIDTILCLTGIALLIVIMVISGKSIDFSFYFYIIYFLVIEFISYFSMKIGYIETLNEEQKDNHIE